MNQDEYNRERDMEIEQMAAYMKQKSPWGCVSVFALFIGLPFFLACFLTFVMMLFK